MLQYETTNIYNSNWNFECYRIIQSMFEKLSKSWNIV